MLGIIPLLEPALLSARALVCVFFVCLPTTAVRAQADDISGHWSGALSFQGSDMPLRLELHEAGDALQGTLDVPGLLMAWEPAPVTSAADLVEVELPFGLGLFALEFDGDRARAEKPLGANALSLQLERTEPPAFTLEDVSFASGDLELPGTLLVPHGPGPHPAVVLLHNSASEGRQHWTYRSWADLLGRQGLAVLFFDKRDLVVSGSAVDASLRQLADDGLAAVRFLRSRTEVDPARIGLKAESQGAWVAEQVAADFAASDEDEIAFLLLVSAASGTPREQELQKIEHGMRDDGRDADQIQAALAYMDQYFEVVRTGSGWDAFDRAVQRAQREDWGQYVDQPRSDDDLRWWRANHAFSPAQVVSDLDVPVLLLYGGADWITPPAENAAALRGLFPSAERVAAHTYPGADHRLELRSGYDAEGVWRWPRVGDGLHETVAAWISAHDLN